MAEAFKPAQFSQQDIDPRISAKAKLLRESNPQLVEKIGVTDMGNGSYYITAYYKKGADDGMVSLFKKQLEKEMKSLGKKTTIRETPDESRPENSSSWMMYLPPKKPSGQVKEGFLN